VSEPSASRLADLIAAAAKSINAPRGVGERLRAVAETAPGTIPGFDAASISLTSRDGPVATRAATGPLVEELDALQYRAQEGPCLDALLQPGPVLVPAVRHEQRWPSYVPRAVAAGVKAQMAIHLGDDREVRGALNLYSTTVEGIHPEAPGIASLFATHAALALG